MLPGVLTILRLETPNTEGPRLSHHPMWPGVPLHALDFAAQTTSTTVQLKKDKACTPTLPILLAFVLATGRLTRGGRQSLKHGLGAIKPRKHSVSAAQRQTCLHLFLAEPPARAPSLLLVAHKP